MTGPSAAAAPGPEVAGGVAVDDGSLTLDGVSKSFGGIRAIHDVTFTVPTGEVTCLVGPNGAGKTTLFNLITGVLRPDSGRIHYRQRDLTTLRTDHIVRWGVARSFQGVRLFASLTAAENVEVGVLHQAGQTLPGSLLWPLWYRTNQGRVRPRTMAILERIGLTAKAAVVAEELSLAEQKLLAVGRLLATDARMLLLDEPLSGLDERSSASVLDVLRQLARGGHGVLLIEHNFDVVRSLSDRAVFLSEGEVMFIGAPEEITAKKDLADLYFGDSGRDHE